MHNKVVRAHECHRHPSNARRRGIRATHVRVMNKSLYLGRESGRLIANVHGLWRCYCSPLFLGIAVIICIILLGLGSLLTVGHSNCAAFVYRDREPRKTRIFRVQDASWYDLMERGGWIGSLRCATWMTRLRVACTASGLASGATAGGGRRRRGRKRAVAGGRAGRICPQAMDPTALGARRVPLISMHSKRVAAGGLAGWAGRGAGGAQSSSRCWISAPPNPPTTPLPAKPR